MVTPVSKGRKDIILHTCKSIIQLLARTCFKNFEIQPSPCVRTYALEARLSIALSVILIEMQGMKSSQAFERAYPSFNSGSYPS